MLYMSPTAEYKERVPLRGGVPLIFPQFGSRGPLSPSHGFARIRPWKLKEVDAAQGRATFSLRASVQDLSPEGVVVSDSPNNMVQLVYTIEFNKERLRLQMRVRNNSEEVPVTFSFAFHTYFAIDELSNTIVNGLNLTPYVDNLKSKAAESTALSPMAPVWKMTEEFDRIYTNQRCAVMLQENAEKRLDAPHRMLHISSTSLPDVCVWNPGPEKAKAFKDMPDEDYNRFICVEHGNIIKKAVLATSATWTGTQEIRILSSSAEAKL
ncbi:glucose-6-phosphate 1-epimerase [Strigomonas culicis]|nr:glucose-6-phosphate 1-epimerase [Strigomonas culicis]|eukprot:EPY27755.1 glucose-6-phosphate 1-epimerase [Strigomonas culicis]